MIAGLFSVEKGGNLIPLRQLFPSFIQWLRCYTLGTVEGATSFRAGFSMKYVINLDKSRSKVRGIVRNGPPLIFELQLLQTSRHEKKTSFTSVPVY